MLKLLKLTFVLLVIIFTSTIVSSRDCHNSKLELQDDGLAGFRNTQAYRSYIVFFKSGTDLDVVLDAEADVECAGGIVTNRYRAGVIGFSARVPADLITTFATSPHVQVVEEDQEVHANEDSEQGFGI
ncbi:hypothetical protein K493DRAFT_314161 [Basidiobolus meristosporus CBS 931.73]|uniref:Inhibitor I9 domain-containing protein n=1 Tax=Basidiobolus meristosporus CBS 931.73 TaxID=1314790 RepID=A0A1Y1YHI2_9FUNG|nr:hypothetical protein K493DRAFT_314161 [Basidiobolus meristosporus CBS 931.73]|eukprot:ORX97186.1 hypothetical protein K493DRAFT_314161 [Basidiobolus meristosporus CBS 931.73]